MLLTEGAFCVPTKRNRPKSPPENQTQKVDQTSRCGISTILMMFLKGRFFLNGMLFLLFFSEGMKIKTSYSQEC